MGSLRDHFVRHGRDFGSTSPEHYARQAWEFLQRAMDEGLPAKVDEDGVIRVYEARTKSFAAYNRDGTAKTFFKPQRPDYFRDQPGKLIRLKRPEPASN
jgi:pyocin large subunit-like protein